MSLDSIPDKRLIAVRNHQGTINTTITVIALEKGYGGIEELGVETVRSMCRRGSQNHRAVVACQSGWRYNP